MYTSLDGLDLAHALIDVDALIQMVIAAFSVWGSFPEMDRHRGDIYDGVQKGFVVVYVPGQFVYAVRGKLLTFGLADVVYIGDLEALAADKGKLFFWTPVCVYNG